MKIFDLGKINGDMLLFGGVYSNLSALNSFISVAENLGIPPKNCICTGDIVAYCADAEACVDRVREFGFYSIAGNCEVQLASGAKDCGCGYEQDAECAIFSRDWYAHAQKQVSSKNKDWMRKLPDRIIFSRNNERFAVIHGSATDISRFIWPVTHKTIIADEIDCLIKQVGQIDHVIAGHSGIPMQRKINGVSWTNTGAIGMPAHNGSPSTNYGLLQNKGMYINSLNYDFHSTYDTMKSVGLTQGYEKTLKTGYWPSEDTLPKELRR